MNFLRQGRSELLLQTQRQLKQKAWRSMEIRRKFSEAMYSTKLQKKAFQLKSVSKLYMINQEKGSTIFPSSCLAVDWSQKCVHLTCIFFHLDKTFFTNISDSSNQDFLSLPSCWVLHICNNMAASHCTRWTSPSHIFKLLLSSPCWNWIK